MKETPFFNYHSLLSSVERTCWHAVAAVTEITRVPQVRKAVQRVGTFIMVSMIFLNPTMYLILKTAMYLAHHDRLRTYEMASY